jgi:type III pantothenate kinase
MRPAADAKGPGQAGTATVLAIDIGNTRAHVGVVDIRGCVCLASAAFPAAEIGGRLFGAIDECINAAEVPAPDRAVLAVVVAWAGAAAHALLQRRGIAVHPVTASAALPFAIRYQDPHTLGADRIANALYAVTVHPHAPVVIISAGTAVVVDHVAANAFYGGAILPGLGLQFRSLHHGTDALPDVAYDSGGGAPALPAASTGACIAGGVLYGLTGAIERIVAMYRAMNPDNPPRVIATGGDWPAISPLVNFTHDAVPAMTLIGAACLLRQR